METWAAGQAVLPQGHALPPVPCCPAFIAGRRHQQRRTQHSGRVGVRQAQRPVPGRGQCWQVLGQLVPSEVCAEGAGEALPRAAAWLPGPQSHPAVSPRGEELAAARIEGPLLHKSQSSADIPRLLGCCWLFGSRVLAAELHPGVDAGLGDGEEAGVEITICRPSTEGFGPEERVPWWSLTHIQPRSPAGRCRRGPCRPRG